MSYKCEKPIAILLAVYNGEKYLNVQVDSIINQTNHDWVLYIRDDASIDSTMQIIDDYCAKNDNIIKIEDEIGNLGCYENFRQLLRLVDADYYMFCDADDYWLPEKVQISYDFIREKEHKYPNIPILVHTDKSNADGQLNIYNQSDWRTNKLNPDSISKFAHVPLRIVGGATAIFNNKIVTKYCDEVSPFPTAHDGWTALQTARYGRIFAIHKPLLIYRRHGSNATNEDGRTQTLNNQIGRLIKLKSTLKYHHELADALKTISYGGRTKYYFYRIVVFFKLLWGKLTIR